MMLRLREEDERDSLFHRKEAVKKLEDLLWQ